MRVKTEDEKKMNGEGDMVIAKSIKEVVNQLFQFVTYMFFFRDMLL